MQPLTEQQIRESFVNTTKGDAERVPMTGLHEVVWDEREYLGWHDAKAPQRAYLTVWQGDRPVSFVLRAAERRIRGGISAMCSLCHSAQPGGQVRLFAAPRTGPRADGRSPDRARALELRSSPRRRLGYARLPADASPRRLNLSPRSILPACRFASFLDGREGPGSSPGPSRLLHFVVPDSPGRRRAAQR